jgi:hypothetical protein
LLKVETAIADVLGRLSMEPGNDELEKTFQELLQRKKEIEKGQ